ncbi:MAG: hypothetical protein ACOYOK_01010 [Pseudobdellovibrionaceae bacterium]
MKTTILQQALSALVAVLALGTAHAGGKVGSGAGGMLQLASAQLLSTESHNGVVQVPFPGFDSSNEVVVVGKPGADQDDMVTIAFYKVDPSGAPVFGSMFYRTAGKLNQPFVNVPPGPILVEYSNSWYVSQKKAGQRLVIHLRKIAVPKTQANITFDVFIDYNNRGERLKDAIFGYISPLMPIFLEKICASKEVLDGQDMQQLCRKLKAAKARADIEGFAKTNTGYNEYGQSYTKLCIGIRPSDSSGSLESHAESKLEASDECDHEPYYDIVTDPKPGEFVSVLPGTYGILWQDENGRLARTLGIQVD